MAIELRQQLKLSQQLIMTPQLQLAIKLLQLSRLELMDTLRQELEENPILEEDLDTAPEANLEAPEETDYAVPEGPREIVIEERLNSETDWANYLDEYNTPGRGIYETEKKETPSFEAFLARKETLQEHLLWQLSMVLIDPEQERIGSLIIGNINPDGYLDVDLVDLAETLGVSVAAVEATLALIQSFDPTGIGARNLQECLLIQAQQLGLEGSLVATLIRDHLGHIENRNPKAICKALKVDLATVFSAIEIIRRMEPKPGRIFSSEEAQYITPDIYVYKLDDEYIILQNDDGLPKLRINSLYKESMKNGHGVPKSAREYMNEKMRSATWLIRSIHQRQKTIYRVVESILKFQRDFFDKGIAYLKPLVLRDVAQDIGMHESTISRVTSNKYVHTPQGIFELKYFFNSSIPRTGGEAMASASVQDKIRYLIENEDPHKPLSDSQIVQVLDEQDIKVARRTVAKYREMMRILPSHKRKPIC